MKRFYGGGGLQSDQMDAAFGFVRPAVSLDFLTNPDVCCSAHEARSNGGEGRAPGGWMPLLEGVLQNLADVVKQKWSCRPVPRPNPPPNTRVKLTVRSAACRAIALPAVGRPALTLER